MKSSLDCMPCFVRQALEAARMVSPEPAVHERIVREVLGWAREMDFRQTPPSMGQRIHRRLREITGAADPYREAKVRQNRMAMKLAVKLRDRIVSAPDPVALAARLAIAGNVIDMGVNGNVDEQDLHRALNQALDQPMEADWDVFREAIDKASDILYLADNAGEIAFDRLLIEQLPPGRITLVVRGAPVLNDVTRADAQTLGLHEIVEVIDNGSDAPGTILEDCSEEFRRRFACADLVLSKGQGNYEALSDTPGNMFFLFKAKCPVVAAYAGVALGAHVLNAARVGRTNLKAGFSAH